MPDDAPRIAHYRRNLGFRTDAGIAPRARIGLVTLATDQTIETSSARLSACPASASTKAASTTTPASRRRRCGRWSRGSASAPA